MDAELTTAQARGIWRLRRRFAGRDVRVHPRAWGVIVEVVADGHTVAVTSLDHEGVEHAPERIRFAAAA